MSSKRFLSDNEGSEAKAARQTVAEDRKLGSPSWTGREMARQGEALAEPPPQATTSHAAADAPPPRRTLIKKVEIKLTAWLERRSQWKQRDPLTPEAVMAKAWSIYISLQKQGDEEARRAIFHPGRGWFERFRLQSSTIAFLLRKNGIKCPSPYLSSQARRRERSRSDTEERGVRSRDCEMMHNQKSNQNYAEKRAEVECTGGVSSSHQGTQGVTHHNVEDNRSTGSTMSRDNNTSLDDTNLETDCESTGTADGEKLVSPASLGSSVSTSNKLVQENRHYVKVLGKVLCLTAKQKMSQRVHFEGSDNSFSGNFFEILELLSEHDDIVKGKLKGLQQENYTSLEFQGKMLQILADIVREDISKEVRASVDYSITIDESIDMSGKKLLSLIVRYMYCSNVHEELLDFCQIHEADAKYLKDSLKKTLASCNIDPKFCVGQTYDGASVLGGLGKDVHTLFRQKCAPYAIYIHCYNHRLNTIIVDSAKSVRLVERFFSFLEALHGFISLYIPHGIFLKKQAEMSKGRLPQNQKKLNDSKRACHYFSCRAMLNSLPAVMEALREISDEHTGPRAHEAISLLKSMDYAKILCAVMFVNLLQITKKLSDMLLSPSLDFSAVDEMVQTVQDEIKQAKNENTWHDIWVRAVELSKQIGVAVPKEGSSPCDLHERTMKVKKETAEQCATNTDNQHGTPEQQYYTKLFHPVMDCMLAELRSRFDDSSKQFLKALSALQPRSSTFLDAEVLRPLAEQYSVDVSYLGSEMQQASRLIKRKMGGSTINSLVDFAKFLSPYKDVFPDLCRLINIALILPTSSPSCESSLPALRFIKRYVCSDMFDSHASSVAFLGTHPQRTKQIDWELFVSLFSQRDNNKYLQLF